MRIYIATTLSNAPRAQALAEWLATHGAYVTYDWMSHGAQGHMGAGHLANIAAKELAGVAEADAVIVLLPGGRGTHVEMGAALALGKRVVIIDEPGGSLDVGPTTCSFYALPQVCAVDGRFEDCDATLLDLLGIPGLVVPQK